MDVQAQLPLSRQLAMRTNPSPHFTLRFRVLHNLKLAEGYEPEGIGPKDWKQLLDHWDTDASVGLQRGVFYIAGDTVELDRMEAAELLTAALSYFEPANDEANRLFSEMEFPS